MLKVITQNELSSVIDFAWKLSRNPETSSYPLYEQYSQLEEDFKQTLCKANGHLFGYYENRQLIAVLRYFFIESENYLQSKGIYILEHHEQVLDALMNHLSKEFSLYQALFGFPQENSQATSYFKNHDFKCMDSSIDMRLNIANFNPVAHQETIYQLKKADFDSYAAFHDQHFAGVYWTSKRIYEVFDEWCIIVYKPRDDIEGGIFIRRCKDNSREIFGLAVSPEFEGQGIKILLLSEAISNRLEDDPTLETIVFFIEDDDEEELKAAKKVGFHYFSSYQCYEGAL